MIRTKDLSHKFFAWILVFALTVPLLQGCSKGNNKISKSDFFFDTIITITLYDTGNESYIDSCFSLAKKYEQKFSTTIKDSEISKINHSNGKYVTVSAETIELIKDGIQYGEISHGKFDITIGKLSSLWNISKIAEQSDSGSNETDASVIPDSSKIKEVLSHVNYKNIQIKDHQVRLTDPKAEIDLGGIAKGYIADKMREYLIQNGIRHGIINLGGNVLTLEAKNNDQYYSIGIQKPFSQTGVSLGTLSVKDASIVSSGIYERYYRVNGKIYHHLLDTATGYPVENDLYQVTIISKKSMDGDALSTTCYTLGLKKGMELIEQTENTEALFVTSDGKIHYSSGFGNDIKFQSK